MQLLSVEAHFLYNETQVCEAALARITQSVTGKLKLILDIYKWSNAACLGRWSRNTNRLQNALAGMSDELLGDAQSGDKLI